MKDNIGEIMYCEAQLLMAYKTYREAIRDFVKATGFEFELTQTVCSTEEDAEYRDFIVAGLTKVDEIYNK